MKKISWILLFLLNNITTFAQSEKFNLVGEWKAEDYDGHSTDYIFFEDFYFSMRTNGFIIDGKNLKLKAGKYSGKISDHKYELSRKGEYIDFSFVYYIDKQEIGRTIGRFKIINADELQVIFDLNKDIAEYDFSQERISTFKRIKTDDKEI